MCQSIFAIENSKNGKFLTKNGLEDGVGVAFPNFQYLNSHYIYAQMEGVYEEVGGSVQYLSLPDGDKYYDMGVVMLTENTTVGGNDIFITGYIDGLSDINSAGGGCNTKPGKIIKLVVKESLLQ